MTDRARLHPDRPDGWLTAAVLARLRDHGPATRAELHAHIDTSPQSLRVTLRRLASHGEGTGQRYRPDKGKRIHVSAWTTVESGNALAVYAIGNKPDKPMPTPAGNAGRTKRYRTKMRKAARIVGKYGGLNSVFALGASITDRAKVAKSARR